MDLDQEYVKDRIDSVLDRLQFQEGTNPLRELIDGNPYTNLATYRRAANSYRKFLDCDSEQPRQNQTIGDNITGNEQRRDREPQKIRSDGEHGLANGNDASSVAKSSAVRLRSGFVHECTVSELLALQAATLDELRERGIVRSGNGPGGDYAELLFTRAFGWTRTENSTAGFDAVDWSDRRYQIKSRRLSDQNGSRQLSALRRLPEQHFHYLAAVLFEKDYKVSRAAMIPHATVVSLARFREHTNSWTFFLDDRVWDLPEVRDVTQELKRVAEHLGPKGITFEPDPS